MSRPAARGIGRDTVLSVDGTGYKCLSPMKTYTMGCSINVLVNGVGVVRLGDAVAPHPMVGCTLDRSVLISSSAKVLANGRGVGRMGDTYGPNVIVSGSPNVIIG